MNRLVCMMGGLLLLSSICLLAFHSDGKVHFIEGNELKTFAQVRTLPQLKGKVVYLDIWGTSCTPCIAEFDFSDSLKSVFKNDAIEYLYVAVNYGRSDDEKRWKKMAEDKNLIGYHILASNELYKDIWCTIKDSVETMYLIPHYIVLDADGGIAIADAQRPSGKEKLYRQLRGVIDLRSGLKDLKSQTR